MRRIAQRAATGAIALAFLGAGAGFAGCNSDDVNKKIDEGQSTVNKELNKAKHKINNSDVEKQVNKAKHKANKAIDDAKDKVNSTANDVTNDNGN